MSSTPHISGLQDVESHGHSGPQQAQGALMATEMNTRRIVRLEQSSMSTETSGLRRVSVANSSQTPASRVQLVLTPPPRNAPSSRTTWEPEPGRVYPRVFYLPGEEPATPAYLISSLAASPSPAENRTVPSQNFTSGQTTTEEAPSNVAAPPLTLRDFLKIRVPEFERRHTSIAPPHIVLQRQDLTTSTACSFTWDSRLDDFTGSTRATSVFSEGEETSDSGWETAEWPLWATTHSAESDLEDEEFNRAPILDIPIPTTIIVTDPDAFSDSDNNSEAFEEDEEDGYAADTERAPPQAAALAGLSSAFGEMSLKNSDEY